MPAVFNDTLLLQYDLVKRKAIGKKFVSKRLRKILDDLIEKGLL